jgi:hypothetical protein
VCHGKWNYSVENTHKNGGSHKHGVDKEVAGLREARRFRFKTATVLIYWLDVSPFLRVGFAASLQKYGSSRMANFGFVIMNEVKIRHICGSILYVKTNCGMKT